jgi:DNA invertase Pin-like site-specific DNA recombinase
MIYGYARVSTGEQNLDRQLAALEAQGCGQIYQEKASGRDDDRPELQAMLAACEAGDTILVQSIDRLSRSTADLIATMDRLAEFGVGFRSIDEPFLDTTTAQGELLMTLFAGLAQFERKLTLERAAAGRMAALARGVKFGRKPKLTLHQRAVAIERLQAGESQAEIARDFNVNRSTISRLFARKKMS